MIGDLNNEITKSAFLKAYSAAKNAVENENYTNTYLKNLQKDTPSIYEDYMKQSNKKLDDYNAFNDYLYKAFEKISPTSLDYLNNVDSGMYSNKNILEFLNDDKAKLAYQTVMFSNKANVESLSNKFSNLGETSYIKNNKVFDTTNTYSGEKFQLIDNLTDVISDNILKENYRLNELYKDNPLYKDKKDPFLSQINENFNEIMNYFDKTQKEFNPEVIKNDLKDTSLVAVNTYGLENYEHTSVISSTEKLGANYIKKEWLSSELYQNYEAVDMSDNYKYGSMDKNTQFSNAMKFAQIFGIDEEGQKTEQFKEEAILFNELYYSGIDYMIDNSNINFNFSSMTDDTSISKAKDFFGNEFVNNMVLENENNVVNIGVKQEDIKQRVSSNVINMMTFVDNEDDLTKGLQGTQDYITNIKYLDKNKDSLTYLESKLDIGSSAENYDAMIKYNLALEDNERDREELLKYFEMMVKRLEETNTIDEYIDYDKKDSLPSIVSPIFRKTVYA